MNIVDISHGVFVGDYQGCDARGREFPLCIHIWSKLNLSEDRLCRVCKGIATRPDKGLSIEYSEGQPLSTMSISIDELVSYVRRPGNVLIHCAAGSCRSPTLALLAKIVRNDCPWGAIGHIFRMTWEHRNFVPQLLTDPTGDIIRWWESQQNKA